MTYTKIESFWEKNIKKVMERMEWAESLCLQVQDCLAHEDGQDTGESALSALHRANDDLLSIHWIVDTWMSFEGRYRHWDDGMCVHQGDRYADWSRYIAPMVLEAVRTLREQLSQLIEFDVSDDEFDDAVKTFGSAILHLDGIIKLLMEEAGGVSV